jgi:hypothetical protein
MLPKPRGISGFFYSLNAAFQRLVNGHTLGACKRHDVVPRFRFGCPATTTATTTGGQGEAGDSCEQRPGFGVITVHGKTPFYKTIA